MPDPAGDAEATSPVADPSASQSAAVSAAVDGDSPATGTSAAPVTGIPTGGRKRTAPKQTLAGRVWVGLVAAAVLLVLVIIFIAENTKSITVNFLGTHGHISEALALLIAVVVGFAITLLVGSARIIQLSVQVRRERRKRL